MDTFSEEIEVRGHLIDSSILTKIFDVIMDLDGEFDVLEFSVGKKKMDPSFARLVIHAKSQKQLDKILETANRIGAVSPDQREAKLVAASRDMVMPENFYSTTNNRTHVFYKKRWIKVDNMMMDKCIVVKGAGASCVPIRDVKKGDRIVVGDSGVRVVPPERPREGVNVFERMGSGS